jgi:hypothetical protein
MMNQLDLFNDDIQNQEGLEDLDAPAIKMQNAVLWGTDWTAETIVSQIKKGRIDLNPKFQRREAWDDKRKSLFIESLICGFPIPQIILAEGRTKNDPYIVIDGKQRLLSLRRFFSDSNDDIFVPLKLKGLSVLGELNNKTYDRIKNDPRTEDIIGRIENQPIRTVVIRNWPSEEFLYTVFHRLNTGSLPLSTQELRQALHPGSFLDFCDEYTTDNSNLYRILNISKADYRMRDIELMVRFFAFKYFINSYAGNLKSFLDHSVKTLNEQWQDNSDDYRESARNMDYAIEASYTIFGEYAFRKYKNEAFDNKFNRAVFDIMTYYFSNEEIRNLALAHPDEVLNGFKELSSDIQFVSSFETSTKDTCKTSYRFVKWGEKLSTILQTHINLPNIQNGAE